MKRDEFLKFQKETFEKLHEITKAKNADYSAGSDDAFANFKKVETMGIATTEQGFLTRMSDKMCRIISFTKSGQLYVKDESVEDTLFDLANYCILMAGFIKSKKESLNQEGEGSEWKISKHY